jgi:hypothetical protein
MTTVFIDILNTHDIELARQLYKFLSSGNVLLGVFQIKKRPELLV